MLAGKAILKCLLPILVGVIYEGIIFSKTPFRDLAPTAWLSEIDPDSYKI